MALKIVNKNSNFADHEREVEEHISTADPSHRGRSLMRTFIDAFEAISPEGSYPCLVYSPIRESLLVYQRRFGKTVPLPLIKTYICALLMGLDYLHKTCRTVHTGRFISSIYPCRQYRLQITA